MKLELSRLQMDNNHISEYQLEIEDSLRLFERKDRIVNQRQDHNKQIR